MFYGNVKKYFIFKNLKQDTIFPVVTPSAPYTEKKQCEPSSDFSVPLHSHVQSRCMIFCVEQIVFFSSNSLPYSYFDFDLLSVFQTFVFVTF